MADVEQLKIALRNAHNAGDTEAARRLASMLVAAQAPPAPAEAPPAPMGYEAILSPVEAIRGMESPAPAAAAIGRSFKDMFYPSAEAPAAAPMGYNLLPAVAAEMLSAAPFVGEWTDEMANRISPGLGERFQAEREALRTSYPALSIAANLAGVLGSFATGAGALGAVARGVPAVARGVEATRRFLSAGQGVGRPAQAIRAGGVGAGAGTVEGAVSGAGAAEEGERFGGAMRGALLGGAFGGAAGLGATGMQALASRLRGGDAQAAQKILSEQAGFEVSPQAAATVQDLVMRGDVDAAARMMQQLGNEATLAGASQRAAQGLGDVSRMSPEAAQIGREAIEGVTQREVTALTGRLNQVLGQPASIRDINAARNDATRQQRDSLYQSAYNDKINYQTPTGVELIRLYRDVRRANPEIVSQARRSVLGRRRNPYQVEVKRNSEGKIVRRIKRPTIEMWDAITRRLNAIPKKDPDTGAMLPEGIDAGALGGKIRGTLRSVDQNYDAAVQLGGKNAARRDALLLGNELLDDSTTRGYVSQELERVREWVDDTADIEAGLRSRLDEVIANTRTNISRPDTAANAMTRLDTLISSDAARAKITEAIGKDKADQIFDELANVRATLDLRRAANVSERASATETVRKGLQIRAPLLDSLANQGVTGAGTTIFRALTGRTEEAREIQQQQLAVEIARVLTQMKGQNARDALALMRRYETTGKPLNEKQARMVAKVVTLPSALAFYSQRAPIAESATEAMLSLGRPETE